MFSAGQGKSSLIIHQMGLYRGSGILCAKSHEGWEGYRFLDEGDILTIPALLYMVFSAAASSCLEVHKGHSATLLQCCFSIFQHIPTEQELNRLSKKSIVNKKNCCCYDGCVWRGKTCMLQGPRGLECISACNVQRRIVPTLWDPSQPGLARSLTVLMLNAVFLYIPVMC